MAETPPVYDPHSKGARTGEQMADALIAWAHMMYQKATAKRVLGSLIVRLVEKVKEFD